MSGWKWNEREALPGPLSGRSAAFGSHRFNVQWTGAGAAPPLGFSQVLMPALPASTEKATVAAPSDIAFPPPGHLVLRRAFDGERAMQQWWQRVQQGKLRTPRTVTVQLLAADNDDATMQWRFWGRARSAWRGQRWMPWSRRC